MSCLQSYLTFLKTAFRQKLIKNDAGEAWDPSRKMRPLLWCELWQFDRNGQLLVIWPVNSGKQITVKVSLYR